MPFPIAAAIGAAGGILTNYFGNRSIDKQNQASQQWSRDMYDLQRKDNLADWTRQNEYNSPAEQMARFKEAGLNPNLMYGQGNSGNASAPSKTSAEKPQFGTSTYESLNILDKIYDLEAKRIGIDGMIEQNMLIKEQQAQANAIAGLTHSKISEQEVRNVIANSTKNMSIEQAKLVNKQLRAAINNTIANTANTKIGTKIQQRDYDYFGMASAQPVLKALGMLSPLGRLGRLANGAKPAQIWNRYLNR